MPISDNDRDMLASIPFGAEVSASFCKHFPHRSGKVRVEIYFEGQYVTWQFEPLKIRSAAPSSPDDKTG